MEVSSRATQGFTGLSKGLQTFTKSYNYVNPFARTGSSKYEQKWGQTFGHTKLFLLGNIAWT